MTRMRTEIKTSCLKRLKRIEGQIRGLAGMVEDDRYCIDVVTQIAAAKAALRRVEEEILRDHVAHCVEHAISSGDKADQRRKIAELMDVVSRADRYDERPLYAPVRLMRRYAITRHRDLTRNASSRIQQERRATAAQSLCTLAFITPYTIDNKTFQQRLRLFRAFDGASHAEDLQLHCDRP